MSRFTGECKTPATSSGYDGSVMAYVLVVDDEESIRKLLARWLGGWGYESKQAANATEASPRWASSPRRSFCAM